MSPSVSSKPLVVVTGLVSATTLSSNRIASNFLPWSLPKLPAWLQWPCTPLSLCYLTYIQAVFFVSFYCMGNQNKAQKREPKNGPKSGTKKKPRNGNQKTAPNGNQKTAPKREPKDGPQNGNRKRAQKREHQKSITRQTVCNLVGRRFWDQKTNQKGNQKTARKREPKNGPKTGTPRIYHQTVGVTSCVRVFVSKRGPKTGTSNF